MTNENKYGIGINKQGVLFDANRIKWAINGILFELKEWTNAIFQIYFTEKDIKSTFYRYSMSKGISSDFYKFVGLSRNSDWCGWDVWQETHAVNVGITW